MAFQKKTWVDRLAEFPGRRLLKKISDSDTEMTVDVYRAEGNISREGDPYNAFNMNDLEQRISDEFTQLNSDKEWRRNVVTLNNNYISSGMIYVCTTKNMIIIDGGPGVIPKANFPLNTRVTIGNINEFLPDGRKMLNTRSYSVALHSTNEAANDYTREVGDIRVDNNNIQLVLATERVGFIFSPIVVPLVPV